MPVVHPGPEHADGDEAHGLPPDEAQHAPRADDERLAERVGGLLRHAHVEHRGVVGRPHAEGEVAVVAAVFGEHVVSLGGGI